MFDSGAERWAVAFSLVVLPVVPPRPAAPDRTVHAVLPHTALRHHSSLGMRSPVAHRSGEGVDAETTEPGAVVMACPVPTAPCVLVTGQDGEAFMDIGVDAMELLRRVAVSEVVPPSS